MQKILFHNKFILFLYMFRADQPRGFCGQSLWLLIMRYWFRFQVLPWEFSLKGNIPAVTMVWVD